MSVLFVPLYGEDVLSPYTVSVAQARFRLKISNIPQQFRKFRPYLRASRGPAFALFSHTMTNSEVFPIVHGGLVATTKSEPAPNSDLALAIAAGKGDMGAFEKLYERHNRRVYSLCLRMTQNAAEAEDLAQEAFIQLFRKIGSFRGDSAFTTWLHRLTVNQCLMHFRKRSVKLERTTEEGETPVQVVSGTENPNAMPVMDRIALDNALTQLPPGYRTVFVLHDVEGHEHEEIAKMLGVAVGTSKSQLHKARMKLRKILRARNESSKN
jgi:RNA polymerase sigma-70 factor (ECF subfamily)